MKSNAVWRWACFILLYWELYFCYKNKIKQKHLCSILTLICIALAHSACIQIYICGGYWNQNPSISCQGKLAKFAAYWFSQRPEFLKVSVNDYVFCCRWKRSAVTAATPCPPGWRIWACMSTCKTSCPAATALWTASETCGSWRLSMWVTVMYKDSGEYQRVKLVFRCLGEKKKIRIGKRVWQFTSGSPPKLKQEAKTEGECVFVLNIGKWILKSHSKKINWDFHVWKQELKLLG